MSEENEKEKKDYSLRESFEKVGLLPGARLLCDQKGRIIDGVHSMIEAKKLGLKIPAVRVNIRDPGDAAILKLVTNKCRRELDPEEITVCLDLIGHHKNWRVKDFLDRLPFSYSWLMRYLPDHYKDAVKAKAGAEGGKATARAFREARESAAKLQPKSEDTRYEERAAEVSLEKQEQPAEEEDLKKPKAEAEIPQVQEPFEHFNSTFHSHLDFSALLSRTRTIEEKDLPAMFEYVNKNQDCAECPVKDSCERLIAFCQRKELLKKAEQLIEFHYRILTLVPSCVKSKIIGDS